VFRLVTCVNVHGDGELAVRLDEALNPRRPRFSPVLRYFTKPEEWPFLLAALELAQPSREGFPSSCRSSETASVCKPSSANEGLGGGRGRSPRRR
jgi:hypothetical protein